MRATDFHFWWITDERTGKRRKTTWRMTADNALARYPNAEPVEGSEEVRYLPETEEDRRAVATSAFLASPK
jgi:hypothetical protein